MPGPTFLRLFAVALLGVTACAGGSPQKEESPEAVPSNLYGTSLPMEAAGGGAPEAPASAAPTPPDSASPAPPAAVPTASATASASATQSAGVPVEIALSDPKFTSGDVPKAKGAIEKLAPKLKACIDDAGGLTGASGTVEVQFLVRSAGKAEGVDVVKTKGIADAAKKCIVSTLQKKTVGTPSTDPVGVTIVLTLSPAK